jgi:hypothetical protein
LCVAADNGVLFLVNEDETPPFLMKRSWLIWFLDLAPT